MARQTSAPIRSSAAEVLTYIASTGDPQDSIEMRYEAKDDGAAVRCQRSNHQ